MIFFFYKICVSYNSLESVYNKYGLVNCILNKGDIVLFNHLIPHGSTSNNSFKSRISLVITYMPEELTINKKKKDEFIKKRKEFEKKELLRKLKDYE